MILEKKIQHKLIPLETVDSVGLFAYLYVLVCLVIAGCTKWKNNQRQRNTQHFTQFFFLPRYLT